MARRLGTTDTPFNTYSILEVEKRRVCLQNLMQTRGAVGQNLTSCSEDRGIRISLMNSTWECFNPVM